MTVNAVQNDNSRLYTIVKATAAGAAGGYALKYLYPIQDQENSFNKKSMINYCRKLTNKAKVAEFKENGVKSKAQDVFVKIIESNDKDAFSHSGKQKKIKALGGENSLAGKEFIQIIRNVDETASTLMRRFARAYHIMLKDIRPTTPFIVAGAGIGFLAGFAHNVMKTDFNA
ncbi:hypothetical protein [Succinatimonas hippei]|uniref:hypothetical protein n=1 Tax=Succinatimonas hippei TaxID=626938 RepID=UPI0026F2F8BC|nr:hypothetical protein [Succinatimonas hippei]